MKSAGRALEILELFDDLRRDLSVGEVSARLHYPQSSTSMLMHSLAELGFLEHDRHLRTFAPTERVSLLGSWRSGLTQEGQILRMMKRISRRSERVVWLATRCGFHARDIYIVDESASVPPIIRMDKVRHLLTTGTGHAILSLAPEEETALLVRRLLAEHDEAGGRFNFDFVMESVRRVRRQGYCAVSEWLTAGLGALAIPLGMFSTPQQPLVLGLRLTLNDVRERLDEFLALAREELGTLAASHS